MSCGLAIFVKTPGLSPVKTRLWPALGQRDAETMYLMSAEAVASVAAQLRYPGGITPHWAVAEDAGLLAQAWANLPALAQGTGTLGERMHTVFKALLEGHDAAILIGADAPQLLAAQLQGAAEWLASAEQRLVLGRAADGGFWLIGANFPIANAVWISVAYSSARTADDFVDAMAAAGDWAELSTLHDLDTAADLRPVADALARLAEPTPAQTRLAHWLAELPAALLAPTACPDSALNVSLEY